MAVMATGSKLKESLSLLIQLSSRVPRQHHKPLTVQACGKGIIVSPGGKITVNNCTISNSNVGIKSEGEIYAENLVINDSYLGIKNMGTAEIENLYTEYIDYESIDSTGTLTISDSEFSNTATGLKTGLQTEINNISFTNSGVGIDSNYGILNGQLIQFSEYFRRHCQSKRSSGFVNTNNRRKRFFVDRCRG